MSNASSAPPLTPIAQSAAVIIGDVLRFANGRVTSAAELREIGERLSQLQAVVADAEQAVAAAEAPLELLSYPAAVPETYHVIADEVARWMEGSVSKLGLARLQNASRSMAQMAHEAQQVRPELGIVA
jgi:hypothetical protein